MKVRCYTTRSRRQPRRTIRNIKLDAASGATTESVEESHGERQVGKRLASNLRVPKERFIRGRQMHSVNNANKLTGKREAARKRGGTQR